MSIEITMNGAKLSVSSPYHPDMPERARALGGKWDAAAKVWTFDVRDEARVRQVVTDIYGTDGEVGSADLVSIRVNLDKYSHPSRELYVAGRQVARRQYRDSAVRLGDGVIIIEGGFPSRGGSAKHPALDEDCHTILEVRDVPRAAAEKEMREAQGITIVGDDASPDVRRIALKAEAAKLRSRLEEIEQTLAGLGEDE